MTIAPALVLGTTLGLAIGVGGYTFIYAKGTSYLTDNPAACANCHVMTEQYDGWLQSSHRAVAACNDCHAPHALVPKLYVKAKNGFWHSFHFTLGGYPEPIQMSAANRQVTESTCRSCHADIVDAIDGPAHVPGAMRDAVGAQVSCLTCHRSVGHLH